jgi:hypothetical protein
MKMSDAFPSKYLKAEDVGNKEVSVEISSIEMEEVGEDKKRKPVV